MPTPMPWNVMETGNKKEPYQIYGNNDNGTIIASIHANIYDERLDKGEAKSNALLICIAPDLSEILKQIVKDYKEFSESGDGDLLDERMTANIQDAKEALAKTEI